ncbi:cysteine--tRNA ligase, chloroplastic/mitochondrial-like [Typha latifolia]|uniref:cysteine--tRNA ligase, chloroplastic/mitochondrial-like n=1 Tax=Typha latifolia TaxID=4733 RepID=UPI003C2C98BF
MYVCGVTPYDLSHIGHARAYIVYDILLRYLRHVGYEVRYVRNFTDIDDKIILRAKEQGEEPLAFSKRFCEEFHKDMADLQCLPPSEEPRVSDNIDLIKDMITQIIKNGYTYTIEKDVYFSVDKFPSYGKYFNLKRQNDRPGARVPYDSRKRNSSDFVLWKSAKPDEPSWDSPWGPGRPGWHIECSALSVHYLSSSFDIHGGGRDLIFPHHENEVTQSCAVCTQSNVSYWMHNEFVIVNNEKISKSKCNGPTIREITKNYHPLSLRYFLMSSHYRSPINYCSKRSLESSSEIIFYIYKTLQDCEEASSQFRDGSYKGSIPSDIQNLIDSFRVNFETSMSDDLRVPQFLCKDLMELLRIMNIILKKNFSVPSVAALRKEVHNHLCILGLMPTTTCEILEQLKDKALVRAGVTEKQVILLIEERRAARENKDFAKSDKIRQELDSLGISLMDESGRTVWRPSMADGI